MGQTWGKLPPFYVIDSLLLPRYLSMGTFAELLVTSPPSFRAVRNNRVKTVGLLGAKNPERAQTGTHFTSFMMTRHTPRSLLLQHLSLSRERSVKLCAKRTIYRVRAAAHGPPRAIINSPRARIIQLE